VVTADVTGFNARIWVHASYSTAGRPQANGRIERLNKTLWIPAAKRLPTYVGKDMDREAAKKIAAVIKKDLREKGSSRGLMSWEDFYAFLTEEVAAYNTRPHTSLPKVRHAETGRYQHMSPDQAWAKALAEGWEPEHLPAAVLDDLFRPQEVRTVDRGWVRLPWGHYYGEPLVPLTGLKVAVGYSIHDGSKVWVRDGKGRMVCIAQRNGNSRPFIENAEVHAKAARLKRRLTLIEGHALEAMAEGGVLPAPAAPPRSEPTEFEMAQLEAEMSAPPAAPRIETAKDRFLRATAILASGSSATPEDAAWAAVYANSPEFKTSLRFVEDFGEDALDSLN
jgi:putative transposase